MKCWIACFAALVLLVGLMGLASANYAQSANATAGGQVTDEQERAVPGVTVVLTNVNTGLAYPTQTNESGVYNAPNLPPGIYRVNLSKDGFKSIVKGDIELHVQDQVSLNFSLHIGSVSESITVEGGAPVVDLTSSSLTNEVEARTIRELPLNGRDWTQLATLQPGVDSLASLQPAPQGGYGRGNRGYGDQVTISGGRPQQNNYRIDGISVNDYSNSGPGSVLGGSAGVDAIQEFSVVTSNYSADYGRTSGGIVNAVTRSGTNEFHGSAYEFHRNSALDARNFFDTQKPPFKRNQFGTALGGPIRKDRTFFFANYEGLRQSLGVTAVNNVFSPNARNGILQNPDGSTTTVSVDPAVTPFLAIWPLPNGAINGNVGIYKVAAQQVTTENFVTARVDHTFSEKDRIFGSYQHDKALLTLPDSLNDVIRGNRTWREFGSLQESHTFSSQFVNTARVGFNRVVANSSYSVQAVNPAAGDHSLASVPGRFAPGINITGITNFPGGFGTPPQYDWTWNSFQGYDEAFLTRGRHAVKLGFSIERDQNNVLGTISVGGGWNFSSISNFLTNAPSRFATQLPGTITERGFRQSIVGAYFQDDVRWRSNVTLNMGLRYEMATVPTEVNNRQVSLRSPTDSAAQVGGTLFSNPSLRNFEPRFGFAWDPFRNGKTSVRGGFGFFDVLPLMSEYTIPEIAAAPFTLTGSVAGGLNNKFPTGGLALVSVPSALRTIYVQPNPSLNYVMQWNVSIQRELMPTLTGMMAYVGNRGVHQPFRADDINIVLPTVTPQGYVWPCGGAIVGGVCTNPGTGTRMNPSFGRMDNLTWSSNSYYDALEAQIKKQLGHGWQLQASYTWGKAIDQGSASIIGDPFGNSISSMFAFDPRLRKGLSDFNVAHNLVINSTWNLPTFSSLPRAASTLLGNWQVGGIYQIRTGLPFTPVLGGDPLGLNSNDPWDFPDRVTGPGCSNPVNPGNVGNYIKLQCFVFPNPSTRLGNTGRNSLIGPGLSNLDFSLVKNNRIKKLSENLNLQLRVEFFNILNHANFQTPLDNSTLFDQTGNPVANAGAIDVTTTTSREIQLGLKLTW